MKLAWMQKQTYKNDYIRQRCMVENSNASLVDSCGDTAHIFRLLTLSNGHKHMFRKMKQERLFQYPCVDCLSFFLQIRSCHFFGQNPDHLCKIYTVKLLSK